MKKCFDSGVGSRAAYFEVLDGVGVFNDVVTMVSVTTLTSFDRMSTSEK